MTELGKTLGALCNDLIEAVVRVDAEEDAEKGQALNDQAASIRSEIDQCLTRTLRGATTRGLGLQPDEVADATRIGDIISRLVFVQIGYVRVRREIDAGTAREPARLERYLKDIAEERALCIQAIDDKLVRMARALP